VKLTGSVWKFAHDNISTDQIRSKTHGHLPVKEQASHCLEGLDAAFASCVKEGDIVVAGKNFGCGSSSPAYQAIAALGVGAIVAESFGRIFFRNCISAGLVVTPCPGIIEFVKSGDQIALDTEDGQILNITTGKSIGFLPLPDFLRQMAELGGEKPYLMARLGRSEKPTKVER